MSDPLAQFRKSPVGASADPPPPIGTDGYVAFDAKDKVDRLKIRRANEPTRSPGYVYLLDVMYDGEYGTNFVLTFTFMMVMVRGRNLLPVISALEMGTADYIQEFDPERWEMPTDKKAPFIESIIVEVQDGGPSITDSGRSANEREKGMTRH